MLSVQGGSQDRVWSDSVQWAALLHTNQQQPAVTPLLWQGGYELYLVPVRSISEDCLLQAPAKFVAQPA